MAEELMLGAIGSVFGGVVTYLAQYYSQVHPIKAQFEEFKRGVTYWDPVDFSVTLDGTKACGKSALVARWINPGTDITKLGATTGIATQGPVHVCSNFFEKNGIKHEHRFRLNIYDVGGELEEQLAEIFDEKKVNVAILVIDPTKLEMTIERFSPNILRRTYLYKGALDTIRCLVLYISKTDIATPEQIERANEIARSRILPHLEHRYPLGEKSIVIAGSARTGHNLHELLGFISNKLGFAQYYEKHKSLSAGSQG